MKNLILPERSGIHCVLLRWNRAGIEKSICEPERVNALYEIALKYRNGWSTHWHTLPSAGTDMLFYDSQGNLLEQLGVGTDFMVNYRGYLIRNITEEESKALKNEIDMISRYSK